MSKEIVVGSFKEMKADLTKHLGGKKRAIRKAARKTAKGGARIVRDNVPVAFAELRESVRPKGLQIVIDAPHALAVDEGSRPHTPPLAPLIKWVKLRGLQSLDERFHRGRANTAGRRMSIAAAKAVRAALDKYASPTATAANAPERVARAIQQAIKKRGTKPRHYMAASLPQIYALFVAEMGAAMSSESEASVPALSEPATA